MAGGAGRRDVGVWAGVLAAAACLSLAGVALRGDSSLQAAANWAQIVSVVVALPSLAQVVRGLRRLPPALATSFGIAETVLVDAVSAQSRAETVRRLLDDPDPMPVRWRITGHDEVMDHADNITSGSLLTLSANSEDIAAVVAQFRALRRPRLVILGEGGAGKTTLAVQLIGELARTRTAKDPIPVLFTLADWDVAAGKTLHDWLASRIRRDYPELRRLERGKDLPAHLVSRGRVLPVLDGLDELSVGSRAALIAQLNQSLSATDQFILTSRTDEFAAAIRDAADVLTSALVLEPEPLVGTEAARYLRRCLPPAALPMWADVLAALPVTPALAETTSTALGLWLLREVYVTPRRDPAPLLDFSDSQTLRTHLYEHLIPAVVNARPRSADPGDLFLPRRSYDPARVRAWLTYLAHLLADDDPAKPPNRDIAWWDIAHMSGVLNAWLGAAIAGALSVTTAVVGVLLFGNEWFGLAGLALGAGTGIGLWWILRTWASEMPGYANFRVRGRYRQFFSETLEVVNSPALTRLVGGIAAFVTLSVSTVVIVAPVPTESVRAASPGPVYSTLLSTSPPTPTSHSGISTPPTFFSTISAPPPVVQPHDSPTAVTSIWSSVAAVVVVLGAVIAGLIITAVALTVIRWSETPVAGRSRSSPRRSWRTDRALTGMRVTVLGGAAALTGGMIGATFHILMLETSVVEAGSYTAAVAGAVGILTAVFLGDHHAWLAYLVATKLLAARRRLPYRLLAFLDDAQRVGLLRTAGPVYQFRHADLQKHFTTHKVNKVLSAGSG